MTNAETGMSEQGHTAGPIPSFSVAGLSPEERLIWLLGDLMNAAENYFGAENPKRLGHIDCAAARIIDEIIAPMAAELARLRAERADMLAACQETLKLFSYEGEDADGFAAHVKERLRVVIAAAEASK